SGCHPIPLGSFLSPSRQPTPRALFFAYKTPILPTCIGIAKPLLMNDGLYQAAAALNANSRWQESMAENLAASSIPGFKKQELSFGTIAAGLVPGPAQGTPGFAL